MYRFIVIGASVLIASCSLNSEDSAVPTITQSDYDLVETPYTDDNRAVATVRAAHEQAKAEGKLLLITLGGNWCSDCKAISGMMKIPEIADFISENYVSVNVNVGEYDMNMNVPAEFGLNDWEGVPTLLIVDGTGTILNRGAQSEFRNARERKPQDLATYLWTYIRTGDDQS